METPYGGRAIVTDNFDHIQIIIPARRNFAAFIFIGLYICFIAFGFAIGPNVFNGAFNPLPLQNRIQMTWIFAYAISLFIVTKMVLWTLIGKETITASQGLLTISKNLRLINRTRSYDLNEATNFYVRLNIPENRWDAVNREYSRNYNPCTIHFDYGMKTVSFAENIDEAEANYLLKLIQEKGMLTRHKS